MNDILQPTIECKETSEDGSYGKYVVSPPCVEFCFLLLRALLLLQ